MLMQAALNAAIMTAVYDEINGALGGGAKLQAWSGDVPASIEDSETDAMIAECACGSPVFGTLTPPTAPANAIVDDSDTAAGTVSYYRMKTSSDVTIFQWTESEDFNTDDDDFDAGDTLVIDSLVLTFVIQPPDEV
jgi:hypothetical protein